MIDPRLAWFAIGASCSAVVLGWPWHPRFSRRMGPPRGSWRGTRSISFPDPAPDRQPINPFTGGPVLYYRREYLHSPSTVAECGGPCEAGPEHCHCGQLWRDVPVHFDPGRVQRGNNSGGPTTPKPDIVPGFYGSGSRRTTRWFINNPVQIAKCGGPCTQGPSHCDCGLLWLDVPKPQFPSPREIPGDMP